MRKFYFQEIQPLPGAPALRTFQDWLSFEAKFCCIAAGGTVYCLLLICGLHLRSDVGKVHGRVPYDVASILRRPHLADSGMLVASLFTVTDFACQTHSISSLPRSSQQLQECVKIFLFYWNFLMVVHWTVHL